jgi:DNA replication protein DnaC
MATAKEKVKSNELTPSEAKVLDILLKAQKQMTGNDPDTPEVTTSTMESELTNTIIIPKGMSKLAAADELTKQYEQEETMIDLQKIFEDWQGMDTLVACMKAIEQTFGWIHTKRTFWSNPTEMKVTTDIIDGKEIQVDGYYGKFTASSWDDAEGSIGITSSGKGYVKFHAKKKHSARVSNFFKLVEELLLTSSIYKNKSIVISEAGWSHIENRGSKNIVLNADEELIVNNLVIDPLGELSKRVILFAGVYGTGKTETAMRVGREAIAKGMTFFYLKNASLFTQALTQVKKYQPCVLFMEDVDEIGSGEERNSSMNDILNTLDGVQTKGNNITVIFTTNHENKINPALRRPGRIDVVMYFRIAKTDTIAKIYDKIFASHKGYESLDIEMLAKASPEIQGAVIAEIATRAITMGNRKDGLTNDIVLTSIASMEHQIQFMQADVSNTKNKVEEAWETLGSIVAVKALEEYNN